MLEARNISQIYNGYPVLKDFSYSFTEGEIYGIIGPNGAGKSTLLRIITGMEKPSEGNVFWKGEMLKSPTTDITCMWQKPYLLRKSVRENILYGMKIRGWSVAKREERLNLILDKFHLNDKAHLAADSLSGGEAARVALARTVAPKPRLLVLDEPSANLDPSHTALLECSLQEVSREEKIAIIMVTHDMFQAKRIADKTIFIYNGRLQEHGITKEIFNNPHSEQTGKFIRGEL